MTKIISIILKSILSKEAYNQRRNNSVFILYGIYQLFIRTLKLIFLLAKNTPKVKWDIITTAEIADATPKPSLPYANKQIGKPIFPQFGKIKGGSSLM